MRFRKKTTGNPESGMAIISIAIIVVIGGLMLAGVLASFHSLDRETQEDITRQHMRQVIHALSVYYQQHNRLPCPAEPNRATSSVPFGSERGSGTAGSQYGSCSGSALEGIIPFRTLGFSEREARDGWRNFITYRIAAHMDGSSDALTQTHARCRAMCVWICPGAGSACPVVDPDNPPCGGINNQNINLKKAAICCAQPETGFDVRDRHGNTLVPNADTSPVPYASIHSVAPPTSAGMSFPLPDKLALVMVSHGPNGHGAWLDNGARINVGNVSNHEQQNANNSGIYIATPTVEATANYFDDLVEWRTQRLLYSEVGGHDMNCDSAVP